MLGSHHAANLPTPSRQPGVLGRPTSGLHAAKRGCAAHVAEHPAGVLPAAVCLAHAGNQHLHAGNGLFD